MSKRKIRCASHLVPMLTPDRAKYTVKQVVKMIKARGLKFDAIACRGVSGLLIAPIVAMRLNKSLIVVRKVEYTHSPYVVEGDYGARTYLILDDFIDKGATVRNIARNIYAVNKAARCIGFIAYKRLSWKDSAESFEYQMHCAWWDGHERPAKFFPSGYNTAVEAETKEV